MKYMGSKNRIAKHILPIMLKHKTTEMTWVEPFVGGANMIDKVEGERLGGEYNEYIAEMWKALADGWMPKPNYSREEYADIKNNKQRNKAETGYVGIAVRYCGKWFGGYAGLCDTKSSGLVDYQAQAFRNLRKQIPNIKGVRFVHSSYENLDVPPNSLIYCDPPYEGTTKYKDAFNHVDFWQWCRGKAKEGHTIFVSEYSAPSDFKCIWEMEIGSSLSANGKAGERKQSIERLFTLA